MNKLRITSRLKHKNETFLHVAKLSSYLQVGTIYTLVEFPDNYFIKQALCVDLRTIERKDLTNEIAFLDSDCDLEVFQQILDNRGLAQDEMLTVATFTNVYNSKKYYNVATID